METSGRAPAIPRPTLGLRGRASYRIMSRQVWEGNDSTVNSSKASQGLCLENLNATYSTDSYSSFRAQCTSHFFKEALLDSLAFLRPQCHMLTYPSCTSYYNLSKNKCMLLL